MTIAVGVSVALALVLWIPREKKAEKSGKEFVEEFKRDAKVSITTISS